MISPIPFCPSFEPWAKLTPVQVKISRPRIHHAGAGTAAHLQDQLYGQQGNYAERDGAARQQNAEKIKKAGPNDSELCRQGVRIDDRCDRVCRVVKAVDELEAEGDQQCDKEQQVWQKGRDSRAARTDIGVKA